MCSCDRFAELVTEGLYLRFVVQHGRRAVTSGRLVIALVQEPFERPEYGFEPHVTSVLDDEVGILECEFDQMFDGVQI